MVQKNYGDSAIGPLQSAALEKSGKARVDRSLWGAGDSGSFREPGLARTDPIRSSRVDMRRCWKLRRLTVALALVTAVAGVSGSAQLALASTSTKTRMTAHALAGSAFAKAVQPSHLEHNGDFNGDGWLDLAAGSPEDDVLGKEDSGTLNVLYGSPTGIRIKGNQNWTESKTGLTDDGELVEEDY